MKLNIHGNKIEVTEAIKDHIAKKISKLDKYLDNADNYTANILIKTKNLNQTIEVTIVTKNFTLRAEETTGDLYEAVNEVVAKLERQIRKNKTRISRRYKTTVASDFMEIVADEPEETETKIERRKNIDTKPMDEEEAILQLELINHDFFAFKNVDEECVSIVYRRKDKGYGIINVK